MTTSTKLLLSFHSQLKIDMCHKLGLEFHNTLRVRSMLPKTFFHAFILPELNDGRVIESGKFYQERLLSLFTRNASNESHTALLLRQVQLILEYAILNYTHTNKNGAYKWMFATEFDKIKQYHHIIRRSLNEYFSASCIADERHTIISHDGNVTESDNPVEMVLLSRLLYEQDLFQSLLKHISVSSLSKIAHCKRDIYYWQILRGMTKDGWNKKRRLYIDQEPVTPFVAFAIRRLFEHIGYLKHSIYEIKAENIWGVILNKSPACKRSCFSGLVDEGTLKRLRKKYKCIVIDTTEKELGHLYLYDEKKKSDVYKEYSAVLAMMTTIQNPEGHESVVYCDSRLNHNQLDKSYDLPTQFPMLSNRQYTLECTTTAVNKLLSWASSEDYFAIKSEPDNSVIKEPSLYETETNADDPSCLSADDYESCRILTESFVLEFLHWTACQPPGLVVSQN